MEKESIEIERFPREVVIFYKERYLCWSTREKKPTHYNINPKDFLMSLSADWGPYSDIYTIATMRIAREFGSSLGPSITREEIIRNNQLGENQQELNLDQILEKYMKEGLSDNLLVEFGTLEYAPEVAVAARSYQEERVKKEIERHKEKMERLGFKFVV